jgi:hypothetical protein
MIVFNFREFLDYAAGVLAAIAMAAAVLAGMEALLWAPSARSDEYVLHSESGSIPEWIPFRMGEVGQIMKGVAADGAPLWECPDGVPLVNLTYRSQDGTLRTIKACAGTEIYEEGGDVLR